MDNEAITKNDLRAILQELGMPFTPLDYYPVGAYFETSDSTFDPNTVWGGTWVLENPGLTHVSAGTGYTVSGANSDSGKGAKDGGAATVTLNTSQIPGHNHGVRSYHSQTGFSNTIPANSTYLIFDTGVKWTGTALTGRNITTNFICDNTGGGGSHENMPPYINVYRWHRTA